MNGINSKRRTACGIIDAADLNSAPWFLKEDAMILYDTRIPVSLEDYGIQIPLRDSRATRTFDTLRSDPRLGPKLHQWHVARIEERLSKTDLLRAHSRGYVEQLFSDQLEKVIVSTYELIDSNGQYHRYDPTRATRPAGRIVPAHPHQSGRQHPVRQIGHKAWVLLLFFRGHAPCPCRSRQRDFAWSTMR